MASDDRLTERPPAPRGDDRLTDQPPPGLPPLAPFPADSLVSPVTIRVVAFVILVYAFWPFAISELLLATRLFPRPAGASPTPAEMQALMRMELYAQGLAFPLQVASILLGLRPLGGVWPEQIGLAFRRLGRNCLWGLVGWLALTPICFAVNYAVIALYGTEAATNVQEHPFVQLSQQGLTPLEWFLLIFTATVSAPVMEELLFRGALQSWLEGRGGAPPNTNPSIRVARLDLPLIGWYARLVRLFEWLEERGWASHGIMGLALLTAALMKGSDVYTAWPQGGRELLLHLTPIFFMLGLVAIYPAVWAFGRGPAAPAVFAASALFASVHSFAWPSPVALFLLALGLGWMAYRTRSLAGPTLLHGLFNAVSCVLLFVPDSALKI